MKKIIYVASINFFRIRLLKIISLLLWLKNFIWIFKINLFFYLLMQGLLIFGYLNLKSRISFFKITYLPFFKTFSLFSIINRPLLTFMVAKGWLFDVNLYFLHLNAQDVIIFELWFFLYHFRSYSKKEMILKFRSFFAFFTSW